jgi:hypothetical protein
MRLFRMLQTYHHLYLISHREIDGHGLTQQRTCQQGSDALTHVVTDTGPRTGLTADRLYHFCLETNLMSWRHANRQHLLGTSAQWT